MSSEHVGHLDALRVPGPATRHNSPCYNNNVTRQPKCRLVNGNVIIIHESINQSINDDDDDESTCHRLVVESSMSSICF
jgi:hypothetical protein